mgnify:FL=1
MGLRDQSWCSSCGQGIMYTEDENATCGECAQDSPNKLINLIEYMRIHLISLEQDLDKYNSEDDIGYLQIEASISTAQHLMSVANDILRDDLQGKGY